MRAKASLDAPLVRCDAIPMTDQFPRIERLGVDGLLVRFSDRLDDVANRACIAFRTALEADRPAGVTETASSLGSVLVRFDGPRAPLQAALETRLAQTDWHATAPQGPRTWHIPCSYGGEDGPQLGDAANLAGLSEAQAIEMLSSTPVRVLGLGFTPGMPYLGILPPEWDLPRQKELTPRVPAGALVIAVRQLVLFGTDAPTGWRQIGRTGFQCLNIARPRPIALRPGDHLLFPPVTPEEMRARAAADAAGHGGARLEEET